MPYVYAAMWFIIGLMLIFRFGKENRIFYFAGGFFLFMGAWWLTNALITVNLFEAPWVWVFRGAVAAALLILALWYYKERKKAKGSAAPDKDGPEK